MTVLQVLQYLGLAEQLISTVLTDVAAVQADQSVDAPQIRTYVKGKHIAIDVKITGLA
jgi:hypothetical protein